MVTFDISAPNSIPLYIILSATHIPTSIHFLNWLKPSRHLMISHNLSKDCYSRPIRSWFSSCDITWAQYCRYMILRLKNCDINDFVFHLELPKNAFFTVTWFWMPGEGLCIPCSCPEVYWQHTLKIKSCILTWYSPMTQTMYIWHLPMTQKMEEPAPAKPKHVYLPMT